MMPLDHFSSQNLTSWNTWALLNVVMSTATGVMTPTQNMMSTVFRSRLKVIHVMRLTEAVFSRIEASEALFRPEIADRGCGGRDVVFPGQSLGA